MNKIQKYIKTFLAALIIVVTITIAFKGVTQIALATEIGKSESITTSYLNLPLLNLKNNTNSQESYIKPNYKLINGNKPTSLDITREEAAEIGVKSLYSVFGLDMNDKVIEMVYMPAQYFDRSKWKGTFFVDGKKDSSGSSYSFLVDSISGEMISIEYERVLPKNVISSFNFDSALEKNAEEYENLAKELAVKLGAIQDKVKTSEYYGQGLGSLSGYKVYIKVTGENGDRAIFTFSRYDKELLGIDYNIVMIDEDNYKKRLEEYEERAKRAEEYFHLNPDASYYSE